MSKAKKKLFESDEFISKELNNFRRKIYNDSQELIKKIIEKNSPVQIGEDVEIIKHPGDTEKFRVTTIKLMAIDSWGEPGSRLSFYYEGIPLSQKGEPMKNRRPKWFSSFWKDGKEYRAPSCLRLEIVPARMVKE